MIKSNKIFGIGLAKTGTLSLCKAMTILGYKSKHYLLDPLNDIEDNDFVNDMPVQTRYKTYDKQYPNSKFILTVREKTSWLQSCKNHWNKMSPVKNSIRYAYRIEQMGVVHYDKNIFSELYIKHTNDVLDYFQQRYNDLLIIDICGGDKWDKLCAFLDKPIPTQKFPHFNKARYTK